MIGLTRSTRFILSTSGRSSNCILAKYSVSCPRREARPRLSSTGRSALRGSVSRRHLSDPLPGGGRGLDRSLRFSEHAHRNEVVLLRYHGVDDRAEAGKVKRRLGRQSSQAQSVRDSGGSNEYGRSGFPFGFEGGLRSSPSHSPGPFAAPRMTPGRDSEPDWSSTT